MSINVGRAVSSRGSDDVGELTALYSADRTGPTDTAGHIDLTWQPELADYVEAYRARNRSRRAWAKITLLAGVVAVIGIIGVVIDDASLVGLGLGGLIAVALVPLVLQPQAVRGQWKRNPQLRSRTGARVEPYLGLITTNDASTSQIRWAGIDSLIETENLFLIQLAGYRRKPFIVVAKRGLPDPSQVADLRAMLTAGTGSPPLTY